MTITSPASILCALVAAHLRADDVEHRLRFRVRHAGVAAKEVDEGSALVNHVATAAGDTTREPPELPMLWDGP